MTAVAPVDLGGSGPLLHLAHANGFPPASYRPLAERLTDRYHVIALPARPLWPGSQPQSAPDWHVMADDLIAGLDQLGQHGIIGVGHSMGGVYTMWAAVRRPELFRAIVLLDPVILPPAYLVVIHLMGKCRLQRYIPLVQTALRRRSSWPSQEACITSYRDKSFFARWPDESLRAYVEAGTRARADGQVELVYPPAWEAQIFATPPVDAWQDVPRLPERTLVVRGEQSNTFRRACHRHMARLAPHVRLQVVSGAGHLLPMERPVETARLIRSFLDTL